MSLDHRWVINPFLSNGAKKESTLWINIIPYYSVVYFNSQRFSYLIYLINYN